MTASEYRKRVIINKGCAFKLQILCQLRPALTDTDYLFLGIVIPQNKVCVIYIVYIVYSCIVFLLRIALVWSCDVTTLV